MTKFVILLVIATAACINAAAQPGFPNFGLFSNGFPGFGNNFPNLPTLPFAPMPVLSPDAIKNLKGGPNSNVQAAYASTSSSSSSANGEPPKRTSSGRVVTNNNGEVHEISF